MPQFGVALSASRPATTAQFTGLNRATDRIQPGTRFCAMNTEDRNVSGRITKLTAAMTVSSLRTTAANAVESDANEAPRSTEQATSTTSPRSSGYRAPSARPSDTRMADRRHQESVDHPVVEVPDQAHPGPSAGEQDGHHDDPGCQEVDVRAGPEA